MLGGSQPGWACSVIFALVFGALPVVVRAQGVDALGAPAHPPPDTEATVEPSAAPAVESSALAPGAETPVGAEPAAAVTPAVPALAATPAAPADDGTGGAPPMMLVFPSELAGVDARIGPPLEDQLGQSGAQLGYATGTGDCVERAAAQVALGQPASVTALWRVLYLCRAQAGLYARVWAEDGQYVIELTGALLDGRGPFVQRRQTDHVHFLQTVDVLARGVLPAATTTPGRPTPAPAVVSPSVSPSEEFEPTLEDLEPPPSPPVQRFGFAATVESAFGVGKGDFYNQLVGARVDVRLSHEIAVGAYLGYANLQGYQGRVGNLATYLQLEDRVGLGDRTKLRIPLRFGAGFIPRNGALIRFAAGLSVPVNDHIEVGVDLLAPTLWILPEGQLTASLSVAVEVIFSP